MKPPRLSRRPSFAPSRRHFLFGVSSFAVAGVTAWLPSVVIPAAMASPLPDSATERSFNAFILLSKYLTAKAQLDESIGRAIFAGLSEQDADFASQVAALDTLVSSTKTPAGALQALLDAQQSALAALPRRVVTGWYLGVVGSGAKARTVAYEQALMYPPIADVIVMPSFARGVPGYWAKAPVLSR
ncbi:sorbitol dehydrogenase family protein [Burkholderia sp. Ax-1719]|uniref:sorbitol dehydrogenase family protein n=1 Tax=Burkholderia sp. Ax-1719 TaxID=2608334 RepID=UPI0019651F99|nr:sorbitol dehydrogenase family protein [Burkholderia sp. Ax-1719]